MKILATVYKEFLLLVRDPGGMALIFIMPLALVIVMALVQDAPFRDYQEVKLEVLFIDEDQDSLSVKVVKAFQASPNVVLIQKQDKFSLIYDAQMRTNTLRFFQYMRRINDSSALILQRVQKIQDQVS